MIKEKTTDDPRSIEQYQCNISVLGIPEGQEREQSKGII